MSFPDVCSRDQGQQPPHERLCLPVQRLVICESAATCRVLSPAGGKQQVFMLHKANRNVISAVTELSHEVLLIAEAKMTGNLLMSLFNFWSFQQRWLTYSQILVDSFNVMQIRSMASRAAAALATAAGQHVPFCWPIKVPLMPRSLVLSCSSSRHEG